MRTIFYLFIPFLFLFSCTSAKPTLPFVQYQSPPAPDYSQAEDWAALPQIPDNADRVPTGASPNEEENAAVDVFFLYPTTYTGHKGENSWNAAIDDATLNERTDATAILNQASIFNGAGSVYAPRYRQAHIYAYYTKDKQSSDAAFQLAYSDVRRAFQYYLDHYNQGRPIIIASHSQGTNHATRLVKEFFDGKPLQQQLVAAYLVGMPILKEEFKTIRPCTDSEETGCFCSWRTFKRGYLPPKLPHDDSIAVTNPLTWTTSETYAGSNLNQGGVLRNFNKGIVPKLTDAQVYQGLLWAAKPHFFGSIFITFKNYHIADYNLYYVNVRKNALDRVAAFLKK